LASALAQGATVVDTRQAAEFGRGAVPGTINIPLNRAFTSWAGSLLPYDRDFYLITDDGGGRILDELARDLSGIGLDRIAGHFVGETVERWRSLKGELQSTPTVSLAEVADRLRENAVTLLDVRHEEEWRSGHVPGTLNIPLGHLSRSLQAVPRARPIIVHCQSGARAAIGASLLQAAGFEDVSVYMGGYAEWTAAGQPRVSEAASSS
ncbi:MAG: beta-lactamase domain protein, partial [Geminicoccaceae bacterium]|nr:beta-lactamase domain protein [Geminicoccaceae bacterium]